MNLKAPNMRMPETVRGQTLIHVGDVLRFLDELEESSVTGKSSHQSARKELE